MNDPNTIPAAGGLSGPNELEIINGGGITLMSSSISGVKDAPRGAPASGTAGRRALFLVGLLAVMCFPQSWPGTRSKSARGRLKIVTGQIGASVQEKMGARFLALSAVTLRARNLRDLREHGRSATNHDRH